MSAAPSEGVGLSLIASKPEPCPHPETEKRPEGTIRLRRPVTPEYVFREKLVFSGKGLKVSTTGNVSGSFRTLAAHLKLDLGARTVFGDRPDGREALRAELRCGNHRRSICGLFVIGWKKSFGDRNSAPSEHLPPCCMRFRTMPKSGEKLPARPV